MSNLRENIKSEMAQRGWNAYDLSEKSGVPQSTIHRFISGTHDEIRTRTILKIAGALNSTEAKLRGLEDFDKNIITLDKSKFHSDLMEATADYDEKPYQCPTDLIERPPVIDESTWKAFPPHVRALIEDLLNKFDDGRLTLDHVKALQTMVDALSKK